jgi:hypothetical protein
MQPDAKRNRESGEDDESEATRAQQRGLMPSQHAGESDTKPEREEQSGVPAEATGNGQEGEAAAGDQRADDRPQRPRLGTAHEEDDHRQRQDDKQQQIADGSQPDGVAALQEEWMGRPADGQRQQLENALGKSHRRGQDYQIPGPRRRHREGLLLADVGPRFRTAPPHRS